MSQFYLKEMPTVKKAQQMLRALNHPLRRRLMELISENSNKMNVTDMYVMLRLEQSVASQHLAILRSAGLVTTRRDGKQIYYSINDDRIKKVVGICEKLNDLK